MKQPLDFGGQTALVVGGSSGIGNAIARALLDRGARVCVTGTRASAADYAENSADLEGLEYRQLDATDHAAVVGLDLPFAALDHLVVSQGVAPDDEDPCDFDEFKRVVDVNLNSVASLCFRFRPDLARSRGSIIIIGSGACFTAVPHRLSYSASKGGVLTLTRSLASAWAGEGIRVNGIAPGYVATRINESRWQDAVKYQAVIERTPMKRWGEPEEIAGVALFLASPLASYVTGQMIVADGGMLL